MKMKIIMDHTQRIVHNGSQSKVRDTEYKEMRKANLEWQLNPDKWLRLEAVLPSSCKCASPSLNSWLEQEDIAGRSGLQLPIEMLLQLSIYKSRHLARHRSKSCIFAYIKCYSITVYVPTWVTCMTHCRDFEPKFFAIKKHAVENEAYIT